MSVLAKGDLQSEYEVLKREVEWHTERLEGIFTHPKSAAAVSRCRGGMTIILG